MLLLNVTTVGCKTLRSSTVLRTYQGAMLIYSLYEVLTCLVIIKTNKIIVIV